MKRFSVALLMLAMLGAAPASAQDFSARDWSGPYLGAQIGYGRGDMSSVTTNLVGTFPVFFDYASDGVLGGARAGYNFQAGRLVLGIEGDVEAAGLSGRQATPAYGVVYDSETTADFLASIRARGGFAFDRVLLYVTGGVAWGNVKTEYSCDGCVSAAGATSTIEDIRVGWTVGGGAEYSVAPNVSLSLEYRYTDLGAERLVDVAQVADYQQKNFTIDTVRLGFSFRFPR